MMIDLVLVGRGRLRYGYDYDFTEIPNCNSEGSAREASPQSPAALAGGGERGVITLVPELPLKTLKGALKGMSKTDIREKKGRP
jgi:hypothetical protein